MEINLLLGYWYISLIVGFGLAFYIVWVLNTDPESFYLATNFVLEQNKVKVSNETIVPMVIVGTLVAGLFWPYTLIQFIILSKNDDNDDDDQPQLT